MQIRPIACVLAVGAAVCATDLAWGGSPDFGTVVPAAGQRGQEVEVVINGARLMDARGLLFDEPGIEVLGVSDAENGKFKAKLKVAPDARLGEYRVRAITASGISAVRLFYVTPYPVVKEAEEDKEAPYKVQPLALNTTVYGSTPGEDQDHFEIAAKKGQRISAEVVGIRLSTQREYDPHLSITKADGTLLAEMDDGAYSRQDPALSIIAPEDGNYRVIIRESTNNGNGPCNYVLHIGTHPRPYVAFPGGGAPGEELKVKLLGDAAGAFEQTVKLPEHPVDRFELLPEQNGETAPQPVLMRVSAMPNVMEAEPNHDVQTATRANGELPLAFNGIIEQSGDVDFFRFTAKKDQEFDVNAYARALRSPLDPVITITNDKGNAIGSNDDAGGPDSYLSFKAPADGEYCISIRDQLGRGGPLYTYRIEIRQKSPKVFAYLPEIVINSSQERRQVPVPRGNRYANLVRVRRVDVGGPVVVEPVDLPQGVTTATEQIDASVDTVPMVFEAAPDAPLSHRTFGFNVKLPELPAEAKLTTGVQHAVDVSENGNQRAYYSIVEDRLPIAVTEEVPVRIELVQPKVPILQNGSMNLKVKAERKNDFKGAVSMSLLYVPPGIGTPGTINIPEGQNEGTLTISANGNAALKKWKVCVAATVDYGKGATWISTGLIDLQVAPPFLAGKLARTFVDQASEGSMRCSLEHKEPFEGKATLTLTGLPAGVTSEPQEITKDTKDVTFPLKAAPDAQVGQHKGLFVTFTLEKDGEPMTATIATGGILRVDKATVAQNTEKK